MGNDLKIVYSPRLNKIARKISGGNIAGTLIFHWLFVVNEKKWTNARDKKLIIWNHELIHLEQQKELLYIFFYVLYFVNWIINIFRFKFDLRKSYKQLAFEREAYMMDGKSDYLSNRKKYAWLKWL